VASSIDGCDPPRPVRFDVLAPGRRPGDPPVDLFVSGAVFLDLVFTGLPSMPSGGREVFAAGMGSTPGGVANLAVAASRLGLRTSMASAFGEDIYGDYCWHVLADHEGIDLSASQRFAGWHSPVTVSLAHDRDRAMVTHTHPPPVTLDELVGVPPRSRVAFVDLAGEPAGWVDKARAEGALLFADLGWDPLERWDHGVLERLDGVHCFSPNAVEAMSYTRTSDPQHALDALAARVPLAVVTCGTDGVIAIDATTGERAHARALGVVALDPTGAGDVFAAAFLLGTLATWPLVHRLRFANLAAALSVRQFGGSLSAPGWGELALWWRSTQSAGGTLAADYGFLDDVLESVDDPEVLLRATATIGLRTAR
jgi:sugar/nucleoside kinase (ribokinase family)